LDEDSRCGKHHPTGACGRKRSVGIPFNFGVIAASIFFLFLLTGVECVVRASGARPMDSAYLLYRQGRRRQTDCSQVQRNTGRGAPAARRRIDNWIKRALVEWGDRDGGCYVTTFDGPMAEQRARDYFDALKSGRLKVLREIE
jgi:hypothetical protein